MSCDYYFTKWRDTLTRLRVVIGLDVEFQTEKMHDQQLSDAVHRISSVLGQYMKIYNDAIECVHNNLQVQKTEYMDLIVNAVVARIIELKHNLQKLEGSHNHFFGSGLIVSRNTPFDVEMTKLLTKVKRPALVEAAIKDALQRVKEKREAMAQPEVVEEEETEEQIKHKQFLAAWDAPNNESDEEKEEVEELTEEELQRRNMINLIKAHEKTRQVTRSMKHQKLKREFWAKELGGTANPQARYELREKSAQIIQKVIRAFLKIKRKRVDDCKVAQLLGLTFCEHASLGKHVPVEEKPTNSPELQDKYKKELVSERDKLKELFMKRKGIEFAGDFRDGIRHWFYEWFESIQVIHGIPKDGLIAIYKGEVPDPLEWLQQYEEMMKQKQANKGKSSQQLKMEKQEAKRLEKMAQHEAARQQKLEAALLRKMMKNPNMHPGYHYPESKKTEHLIEVVEKYHDFWDEYDAEATEDVKRRYMTKLNVDDAYKDAKIEILQGVDEHMGEEYRKLKRALKEDYKNNDEVMPEVETKRKGKKKKKKKVKAIPSERIADNLEDLALHGFVIEYEETKLESFKGDPNFAGDDLRRIIQPAYPQNYELRAFWWDRCHAVNHGLHRILLVGPDGSGKVRLVHALASLNDAMLFELDPYKLPVDFLTPVYVKMLVKKVLTAARAVQPAVIHIRHIERLYYKKEPENAEVRLDFVKRYFVQDLIKKINKHDMITVVGTCSDPWLTRSGQMVKKFPIIALVPNCTYSTAVQLLKEWVVKYPLIPQSFDVSCLAQVLQGYSYGYLEEVLDKFMDEERRVKIAAHGLKPMEVYNFIIEDTSHTKVEYDRYLKWYYERTPTGTKERQHIADQLTFKQAVAEFEEKMAKKRKQKSAPNSAVSSKTRLR
ncbi:uncharacterized protein LOC142973916 [Anticarsia gemmatalis]|uniref:uncharacterized protein LOC142973916 n=1 Tax=Anticarsia gemmatalis TaxID=129554 RepID=UPI003F75C5A6